MEVSDEVVLVVIVQSHECTAHHYVLHLVHRVTQLLQLNMKRERKRETELSSGMLHAQYSHFDYTSRVY